MLTFVKFGGLQLFAKDELMKIIRNRMLNNVILFPIILILILLNSCSESPEKISKGHLESMSHECAKDTDKRLCINELKTKFFNDGNNYVTFEDLNKSQTRRVKLNCLNYKKRGLITYNNCLAEQKEFAVTGKLTDQKRKEVSKSNIEELFESFFYIEIFDSNKKIIGAGSGVAVTKNIIASNCHVIVVPKAKYILIYSVSADRKKSITPLYRAKLINSNYNADTCLVKIKKNNLKPVKRRSFKTLKFGEFVRAIGNPVGIVGHTSTGEINKIDENFFFDEKFKNNKVIIHDASIGSGSSGGPLFDFKGNLIGLNTLGFKTSKGQLVGGAINLAVSADYIDQLLD